jgi:hypothetical protein
MANISFKPHSQKHMKSSLTIGFIGCLLVNSLAPNMVFAQTFDFGTSRKLRTCPSRTAPTKGRISVEQAKQYVACSYEERAPFNGSVKFVDVLSLEVAPKPRSPKPADLRLANLDIEKPIYDLQGSLVVYTCAKITGSSSSSKHGQNCSIIRNPKAIGKCYQTPFSEWHCVMILGSGLLNRPEYKMPSPQ